MDGVSSSACANSKQRNDVCLAASRKAWAVIPANLANDRRGSGAAPPQPQLALAAVDCDHGSNCSSAPIAVSGDVGLPVCLPSACLVPAYQPSKSSPPLYPPSLLLSHCLHVPSASLLSFGTFKVIHLIAVWTSSIHPPQRPTFLEPSSFARFRPSFLRSSPCYSRHPTAASPPHTRKLAQPSSSHK